jgi:hypothetical protein
MRRLILLLLVALVLAPGTWLRTRTGVPNESQRLEIVPVEFPAGARRGEVSVEGVWRLASPNSYFGSYSGLVALGPNDLLAVSDKGGWLRFSPPGSPGSARFGGLERAVLRNKRAVDAEAVAFDPENRQVWVAYEVTNSIERSGLSMRDAVSITPPAMANWPVTSGPEAMTRLPDGRFIVLGEGSPDWFGKGYPGLLFAGDPVEGTEVIRFGFDPASGFRPTDMTALPDGRVLILMRRIENVLPPRFSARIALADPATIRAGESWPATDIATLGTDLPDDNFEGLAAIPQPDGSFILWLISDDNGAALQDTLLYRLRWDPSGTAR